MSVLLWMIRTYSPRSGESPSASKTLVKPMMAFRGVRSSWVIEAMKALFIRRLSSARTVSLANSLSVLVIRVMSEAMPSWPMISP